MAYNKIDVSEENWEIVDQQSGGMLDGEVQYWRRPGVVATGLLVLALALEACAPVNKTPVVATAAPENTKAATQTWTPTVEATATKTVKKVEATRTPVPTEKPVNISGLEFKPDVDQAITSRVKSVFNEQVQALELKHDPNDREHFSGMAILHFNEGDGQDHPLVVLRGDDNQMGIVVNQDGTDLSQKGNGALKAVPLTREGSTWVYTSPKDGQKHNLFTLGDGTMGTLYHLDGGKLAVNVNSDQMLEMMNVLNPVDFPLFPIVNERSKTDSVPVIRSPDLGKWSNEDYALKAIDNMQRVYILHHQDEISQKFDGKVFAKWRAKTYQGKGYLDYDMSNFDEPVPKGITQEEFDRRFVGNPSVFKFIVGMPFVNPANESQVPITGLLVRVEKTKAGYARFVANDMAIDSAFSFSEIDDREWYGQHTYFLSVEQTCQPNNSYCLYQKKLAEGYQNPTNLELATNFANTGVFDERLGNRILSASDHSWVK